MNKERIEQFSDFLLIGEVKGAFKGNPALISITTTTLGY